MSWKNLDVSGTQTIKAIRLTIKTTFTTRRGISGQIDELRGGNVQTGREDSQETKNLL